MGRADLLRARLLVGAASPKSLGSTATQRYIDHHCYDDDEDRHLLCAPAACLPRGSVRIVLETLPRALATLPNQHKLRMQVTKQRQSLETVETACKPSWKPPRVIGNRWKPGIL